MAYIQAKRKVFQIQRAKRSKIWWGDVIYKILEICGLIDHKLASISSMSSYFLTCFWLATWTVGDTLTFLPAICFFLSALTSFMRSANISYIIALSTSTYSSSELSYSISFILSSIYFWRILASFVSRIISCILSAYFYCSFMCSPTLSRAVTVSMSIMACSSWNFLSTKTFFLRP